MAGFRTGLALDRTTLAWIRTTLTMASFGFGLVGFFRSVRAQSPTPEAIGLHHAAIQFGYTLIILGIVATVLEAPENAISVNSVTGKRNAHGSMTIRFGGDPTAANYLRIMPGWSYIMRLYRRGPRWSIAVDLPRATRALDRGGHT